MFALTIFFTLIIKIKKFCLNNEEYIEFGSRKELNKIKRNKV